jgi:hypothetical protein
MSRSKNVGDTRTPGVYVRIVVLVVVLAVFVTLVCGGYQVTAALSAIAACGLVADDISRRLGRGISPRSA